jgi:hypothetical protein
LRAGLLLDGCVSAADVRPQAFAGAAMAFLFTLRSIDLEGRGDGPAQTAIGFEFLKASLASLSSMRS